MSEESVKVNKKNDTRFKKGMKRPEGAGRKAGTPNKKTLALLDSLGSFDPIKELIGLYNGSDDDDLKVRVCSELLPYIYPKRKSVEFKADDEQVDKLSLVIKTFRQ